MAKALVSLGGRHSDAPCGESISGATWVSVCFNADWLDWWRTAVSIRGRMMEAIKGGVAPQGGALWLKNWADDDAPATTVGLALLKPALQTEGVRWKSDPGWVWSKSRLQDLIAYAVEGADMLARESDYDPFVDVTPDDAPIRSLKPLAYGLGLGAVAMIGLILWIK